jgi:hypothetical protein
MKKFNTLRVHKLSITDLGGLCIETINAGNVALPALDILGKKAFDALVNANKVFRERLILSRSSLITPQIHEVNSLRKQCFLETIRTSKAASKSSIETNIVAGKILTTFLQPYHDTYKQPMMSATSTFNFMQSRYSANEELQNAANVLQLSSVFEQLFDANIQVPFLWNKRADEDAEKRGPSPTSLRNNLEKSYHNFGKVVLQTLDLAPSPPLERLFLVMNEIRIKYSKSLPIRLTDANTSVAPIPMQKYTGKHITPIPKVLLKTENNSFAELRFSIDFSVTYRNNIKAGNAKLIIHGKGKYKGNYTSTFYIEQT